MTKKWKKRSWLIFYFIFIQTPIFMGIGILISFHFNRGIYTEYVRAHDKIGEYYEFGKIGDKGADTEKAIEWYKKAGWLGNRRSQYNLGLIYYASRYGEKDNMQALKWFLLAAGSGYNKANHFVGLIYQEEGAQQDFEKAVKYFTISSGFDNRDSQLALANLYRKGLGTEKNYQKAVEYYQKSSDQGKRIASLELGKMYYLDRYGIGNYFEAVKMLKMAYYNGFLDASYHLGLVHADKRYEYNNIFEAAEWYKRSVKHSYMLKESHYALGNLYAEFDQKESVISFVNSAKLGNIKASKKLSKLYADGELQKQDKFSSFVWLLIAKKQKGDVIKPSDLNFKLSKAQIKEAYIMADNFINDNHKQDIE